MITNTSTINVDTTTNTIDFQTSYEYPTSYQVQYNNYNYCPHRLPCGYCEFLMRDCVKRVTPYKVTCCSI